MSGRKTVEKILVLGYKHAKKILVLGRKYAKKTLVLGISYVPQIDFNSIMRYYRGDIFIIIML